MSSRSCASIRCTSTRLDSPTFMIDGNQLRGFGPHWEKGFLFLELEEGSFPVGFQQLILTIRVKAIRRRVTAKWVIGFTGFTAR
jgi:hypothetical protein